jgi:choline dehydrogenase
MVEAEEGASTMDVIVRDGRRRSVFRAYAFPLMDPPNLTTTRYGTSSAMARSPMAPKLHGKDGTRSDVGR